METTPTGLLVKIPTNLQAESLDQPVMSTQHLRRLYSIAVTDGQSPPLSLAEFPSSVVRWAAEWTVSGVPLPQVWRSM